ncbi:hypothetical protein V8C40DRAFT_256786 [Trichoderma camerunense]
MASDGSGAPLAAALGIKEAVERLRDSLSSDDQRQIENTMSVQDVIDSLVNIQKELQQRRENRNLRKLYPFLQGLERYSGVIDTLSNGLSPYLPWIWAPIKLMLQITSDYLDSFDKLIDAYGRIAETLPRLNNLGDAFKNNPTLLSKLSLYYVDILEFHRRAYKFVRRRSWRFFFMTTWANFDIRFNSILAAMTRHSEAIDQEAATIDIIEAKLWREKLASQVAIREKERSDRQRQSVIAWLTLDQVSQDDNRERVLRDCLPGSCDWLLKHIQVISWLKNDSKMPVLWLHGKPGAGKTVICASLLNSLEEGDIPTLFYFCKHHQADTSSKILKMLVLNIIDTNPDLTTMAFTRFVEKHREPSLKVLRAMLVGSEDKQGLLYGIPACRILIDDLDECDPKEQKYIIDDLLQLVSVKPGGRNCKLLICSRDMPEISRTLHKKQRNVSIISLSSEKDSVNQTIQAFVESRLRDLVDEKESFHIGENFAEEIVRIIIDKADGMFLWARLVLDSLSDVDSVKELHNAITIMPRELPELYSRILETICPESGDGKMHKVMRILAWLVFAKRPLKHHEVLHGVGITPETPVIDKWNALDKSAIDKCKPLVEELPDGSIALIHFTAQEFLQRDLLTRRVNSATWEELIAFACVTVIKDSLFLLDPELPRLNQLFHILSGAHALLPYAIHFWLDHVLEYANVGTLPPESGLGQALSSLKTLHDGLYSKMKSSATSQATTSSTVISTDVRLEALSHLTVYSLCASIVEFRRDCASRSASNGQEFEDLTVERDPTLLSALLVRFGDTVSELLRESFANDEISKNELDVFRKQYLQCSFRCRFIACTTTSLGFATEALRASHEKLHVKRLFCNMPNCSRGKIGFQRPRDLNAHKRMYHEEGSILVPPRVRKTFEPEIVMNQVYPSSSDGGLLRQSINIQPGAPAQKQQDMIKHKISLTLDSDQITTALAESRELAQQQKAFSILVNEKLTSTLDVNLICSFDHQKVVCSVDISADDNLVATGCNQSAQVFNIRTGEKKCHFNINVHNLSNDELYCRCVRFTNDGKYLIAGSEDKLVTVWKLQGPSNVAKVFEGHQEDVYTLAVASDNHTIVSGSGDRTVRVWDLRNDTKSKEIMVLSLPDGVTCVAISPDCQFIAVGSLDKSTYLWSMKTGTMLQKFSGNKDSIYCTAFSPDGQTIMCASLDNTITTWAIDFSGYSNNATEISTQLTKRLELHRDFVLYCKMTSDGHWILSCSKDRSVIFWDSESGRPHISLTGHENSVIQIAVGNLSRIFATASGDGIARVWSYTY